MRGKGPDGRWKSTIRGESPEKPGQFIDEEEVGGGENLSVTVVRSFSAASGVRMTIDDQTAETNQATRAGACRLHIEFIR
jgi:hypothetical protein